MRSQEIFGTQCYAVFKRRSSLFVLTVILAVGCGTGATTSSGTLPATPTTDLLCAPSGGNLALFNLALVDASTAAPEKNVFTTSPLAGSSALAIADSQFLYSLDGGLLQGDAITTSSLVVTQFQVPSLQTQGNGLTVTPSNKYLYISENGTIEGFQIDPASGSLTPISGSPFSAGTSSSFLSTDASGQFLYESDSAKSGSLYGFSIGSNGGLTPISGSPFSVIPSSTVSTNPAQIGAVGNSIYVALSGSGGIGAFAVNQSSGVLTAVPASPFAAGTKTAYLAVAKTYVFAADLATHNIFEFKANVTTGTLTSVAASSTPPAGYQIETDPQGAILYVTGFGVESFTVDPNTGLTAFAAQVAGGAGPAPLAITNVSQ